MSSSVPQTTSQAGSVQSPGSDSCVLAESDSRGRRGWGPDEPWHLLEVEEADSGRFLVRLQAGIRDRVLWEQCVSVESTSDVDDMLCLSAGECLDAVMAAVTEGGSAAPFRQLAHRLTDLYHQQSLELLSKLREARSNDSP